MITLGVQRCGSTVLAGISGHLDEGAAGQLQQVLDGVTAYERDLMVDVHHMTSMDTGGLLHLLDLHRHAELLGLRVLVVGWQPQPQRLMADVAGIPGPGTATGERFALAGFRRLIEQRAQRARDQSDFAAGSLPRS
ncbi:STAS domain-containing protein [Streptomyces sp. NPDC059708]|uniref:STAS domain-containing protein n=1 Tax=Streptomyces sp. NPDC059708 TaxID=3346916 RepID=UPI0036BB9812